MHTPLELELGEARRLVAISSAARPAKTKYKPKAAAGGLKGEAFNFANVQNRLHNAPYTTCAAQRENPRPTKCRNPLLPLLPVPMSG